MKKLSEFKSEEQRAIKNEIDAHAAIIQVEDYSTGNVATDLGLCSNCKQLIYTSTEYGTAYAKCNEWEMRLNLSNRIKHCNRFRQRGQMDLYEMKDVAIIIDPDKKKLDYCGNNYGIRIRRELSEQTNKIKPCITRSIRRFKI